MPETPTIDFTPEERAAMLRLIYNACAMLTHPERRKVFDQPGSDAEKQALRLLNIGFRLGLVEPSDLAGAAENLVGRVTVVQISGGRWAFATPEEAATLRTD